MTTTQTKVLTLDHFINGKYVPSQDGKTFANSNPATGEILANVALGGEREIDVAAKVAQKAYENGPWARMSVKERAIIVRRIGDIIISRTEELARAETLDTGKPLKETLEGDIPRAALNFHFFADFASSINDDYYVVSENERHFSLREPVGVIGLITPWNLPLYLATWKIAPCLMMGNSCILKPAEWTPYTACLLGEIVNEAGLPEGVFNVVQGMGANGAGEALTRHPLVSRISFTGETSTGKAIMRAASESLKKVSFELGGKGASIIFDDANLDEAIPTAVRAAFRNQGQICLAGSRLFVHEKIFDRVVEEVVRRTESIKVGDPLDLNTEMGALVSKEHLEKVQSYIDIGVSEGKLLTGGKRLNKMGYGNFLSPAIFTDLPFDSRFCQEEIFGPALPVIPFRTADEVIAMTNSTAYGLSASVWSRDVDQCHKVSSKLKTGLVWVNTWFARDLRTPFGGQKSSGIGREGGKHSLDFFSEQKTISYKYKE